jgi:hypothetical protein
MFTCEALFGAARGREIQDMIEGLIEAPCPCKAGRVCPLLASADADEPPAAVPDDAVFNTR